MQIGPEITTLEPFNWQSEHKITSCENVFSFLYIALLSRLAGHLKFEL